MARTESSIANSKAETTTRALSTHHNLRRMPSPLKIRHKESRKRFRSWAFLSGHRRNQVANLVLVSPLASTIPGIRSQEIQLAFKNVLQISLRLSLALPQFATHHAIPANLSLNGEKFSEPSKRTTPRPLPQFWFSSLVALPLRSPLSLAMHRYRHTLAQTSLGAFS